MAPYERFAAWRECHALALEVYRATRAFPKDELYGLTSQATSRCVLGGCQHC